VIVNDDGPLTCLLGRRVPLFLCFDSLEETIKFFPMLGQHARKPDSISDSSVTSDNLSGSL
jgi:hypothetical protein